MNQIKFTQQTLQLLTLFEKITRASVKDCFEDSFGLLTFVIQNGHMQKALGKGASNVKRLKELCKRNIRVVEFNDNIAQFVANLARPIKIAGVVQDDDTYIMIAPDLKTRGVLIGRNAQTLRNNENIVKRYFPIKELKVDMQKGD